MASRQFGPPRTDFGPAPPGYIPGVGRGAIALDSATGGSLIKANETKGALLRRQKADEQEQGLLKNSRIERDVLDISRMEEKMLENTMLLKKKQQEKAFQKKLLTEQRQQEQQQPSHLSISTILTDSNVLDAVSSTTTTHRTNVLDMVDSGTASAELARGKADLGTLTEQDWYNVPDATGIGNDNTKYTDIYYEREYTFSALDFAQRTAGGGIGGGSGLQSAMDAAMGTKTGYSTTIGDDSGSRDKDDENGPNLHSQQVALARKLSQLHELGSNASSNVSTSHTIPSFFATLHAIFPTPLADQRSHKASAGDPRATITALKAKVKALPTDAFGWLSLCELMCVIGQWDDARETIKIATSNCKQSESIWLLAVRIHAAHFANNNKNKNYDCTIALITQILQAAIHHVPHSIKLQQLYIECAGTRLERKIRLEDAIVALPNNVELWLSYFELFSTPYEVIALLSSLLITHNSTVTSPVTLTPTAITSNALNNAFESTLTTLTSQNAHLTDNTRIILWKTMILLVYHVTCASYDDIYVWLQYFTTYHPTQIFLFPQTLTTYTQQVTDIQNEASNNTSTTTTDPNRPLLSEEQSGAAIAAEQIGRLAPPSPPNPWEIGYEYISTFLQSFVKIFPERSDVWLFVVEIEQKFGKIYTFCIQTLASVFSHVKSIPQSDSHCQNSLSVWHFPHFSTTITHTHHKMPEPPTSPSTSSFELQLKMSFLPNKPQPIESSPYDINKLFQTYGYITSTTHQLPLELNHFSPIFITQHQLELLHEQCIQQATPSTPPDPLLSTLSEKQLADHQSQVKMNLSLLTMDLEVELIRALVYIQTYLGLHNLSLKNLSPPQIDDFDEGAFYRPTESTSRQSHSNNRTDGENGHYMNKQTDNYLESRSSLYIPMPPFFSHTRLPMSSTHNFTDPISPKNNIYEASRSSLQLFQLLLTTDCSSLNHFSTLFFANSHAQGPYTNEMLTEKIKSMYNPQLSTQRWLSLAYQIHFRLQRQQQQQQQQQQSDAQKNSNDRSITLPYCMQQLKQCEESGEFVLMISLAKMWYTPLLHSALTAQLQKSEGGSTNVLKVIADNVHQNMQSGYFATARCLLLSTLLILIDWGRNYLKTQQQQQQQHPIMPNDLVEIAFLQTLPQYVNQFLSVLLSIDKTNITLLDSVLTIQQDTFLQMVTTDNDDDEKTIKNDTKNTVTHYFSALRYYLYYDYITAYTYFVNAITTTILLTTTTTSLFVSLIDLFTKTHNTDYATYALGAAHYQIEYIKRQVGQYAKINNSNSNNNNKLQRIVTFSLSNLNLDYWSSITFYILSYQLRLKQMSSSYFSPTVLTGNHSGQPHDNALLYQQQAVQLIQKCCQETYEPLLYTHYIQLSRYIHSTQLRHLDSQLQTHTESNHAHIVIYIPTKHPSYITTLESLLLPFTHTQIQTNIQQQQLAFLRQKIPSFTSPNSTPSTLATPTSAIDTQTVTIIPSGLFQYGLLFVYTFVKFILYCHTSDSTFTATPSGPNIFTQCSPGLQHLYHKQPLLTQHVIGYHLATSPCVFLLWQELLQYYTGLLNSLEITLLSHPLLHTTSVTYLPSPPPPPNTPTATISPQFITNLIMSIQKRIKMIYAACIHFYSLFSIPPSFFVLMEKQYYALLYLKQQTPSSDMASSTSTPHHDALMMLSTPQYQQYTLFLSFLNTYHLPYLYHTTPLEFFTAAYILFESGLSYLPLAYPAQSPTVCSTNIFDPKNNPQVIAITQLIANKVTITTLNKSLTILEQISSSPTQPHTTPTTLPITLATPLSTSISLDPTVLRHKNVHNNIITNSQYNALLLSNFSKSPYLWRLRAYLVYIISIFTNKSYTVGPLINNIAGSLSILHSYRQIKAEIDGNNTDSVSNTSHRTISPLLPSMSASSSSTMKEPEISYHSNPSILPIGYQTLSTTTPSIILPNTIILNIQQLTPHQQDNEGQQCDFDLNHNHNTITQTISQALNDTKPLSTTISTLPQLPTAQLLTLSPSLQSSLPTLVAAPNENNTADNIPNAAHSNATMPPNAVILCEHVNDHELLYVSNWLNQWSSLIIYDLSTKPLEQHNTLLRPIFEMFNINGLLARLQTPDNDTPLNIDLSSNDQFISCPNPVGHHYDQTLIKLIMAQQIDETNTNQLNHQLPTPLILHIAQYLWVTNKRSLAYLWFTHALSQVTNLWVNNREDNFAIIALPDHSHTRSNVHYSTASLETKNSNISPRDLYRLPPCIGRGITVQGIANNDTATICDPIIQQRLYTPTLLNLSLQPPTDTTLHPPTFVQLGLYPTLTPLSPTLPIIQSMNGDLLIWYYIFLSEQCFKSTQGRQAPTIIENNGKDHNNNSNYSATVCLCSSLQQHIAHYASVMGVIDGELWQYYSHLYSLTDESCHHHNHKHLTALKINDDSDDESGKHFPTLSYHAQASRLLPFVASHISHVMGKPILYCDHVSNIQ